jgi:predicted nucleic acid-binding protein
MAYLLDSNIFIEAKNLHYGFDFCPAFWDWIVQQNAGGTVFSIQKVRDELIAGADELAEWARARNEDFFLAPDESVVPSMTAVSAWAGSGAYDPAAASQFLQVADYYLVAHAHAKQLVVVTHEKPASSPRRIKIPNACLELGVAVISPYDMLRAESARFVLGA